MQIVPVILQKGGVGKTTLTVNLAAALVKLEQRVLVIDLDTQANCSLWLGVTEPARGRNMVGVWSGTPLEQAIYETAEGIDILPSHPSLAGLIGLLQAEWDRALTFLDETLQPLANRYDVVLIDMPPARSIIHLFALSAATRCLAPVNAIMFSLDSLHRLMESIEETRRGMHRLDKFKGRVAVPEGVLILRNNYTLDTTAERVVDVALQQEFGDRVMDTIIPRRSLIEVACQAQMSVFRHSRRQNYDEDLRERLLAAAAELLTKEVPA